jgi:hypothetical protein
MKVKRNLYELQGQIMPNAALERWKPMLPQTTNHPQPLVQKHSNTADTAAAGDHMSRGNRSYISKISSGKRYNRNQTHSTAVSAIHQYPSSKIEAKAELDSHADTTVAGSTCRVIEYTEKVCDVFPFSSEYQPMKQVPVAKVATAYDHPQTGETFILIFVQALYLGDQP